MQAAFWQMVMPKFTRAVVRGLFIIMSLPTEMLFRIESVVEITRGGHNKLYIKSAAQQSATIFSINKSAAQNAQFNFFNF